MRRFLTALCAIFILTAFSACGSGSETVMLDQSEAASANALLNAKAPTGKYDWTDGVSLPVPPPEGAGETAYRPVTRSLVCSGVNAAAQKSYRSSLRGSGWTQIPAETKAVGASYTFLNGNDILRMSCSEDEMGMMYTHGLESSYAGNEALTKTEAKPLIQTAINSLNDAAKYARAFGKTVSTLVELDCARGYSEMGVQLFLAFSVSYDSTHESYGAGEYGGSYIGLFAVCARSAQLIPLPVQEYAFSDIDNDGSTELITLGGLGSGLGNGIYRICLNAYKYGTPAGSENEPAIYAAGSTVYICKNGAPMLTLKYADADRIHLAGIFGDGAETDYGRLLIKNGRLYINEPAGFPYTG